MNTTEIKILLNKYYEGESTLDEEKILRDYFTSGRVDISLREHIPVFAFHKAESTVQLSDDFEKKIYDNPEITAAVPFYQNRRFWLYFSGIAASLLFLFSLFFETFMSSEPSDVIAESQYTEAEARKAYDQTRIALAYVGEKYATGMEPLGEIAKFGNNAFAVTELARFNKELNKLNNNMDKVGEGVDNLSKLSKFTIIVKP